MRATVPTEASAILALVRGLGGRVFVAFEEGTQAQWMHDLLQAHAEHVIVCNMRGRSESGNKSDRIDADGLSEMLRVGSVKSVYHGASGMLTLKIPGPSCRLRHSRIRDFNDARVASPNAP